MVPASSLEKGPGSAGVSGPSVLTNRKKGMNMSTPKILARAEVDLTSVAENDSPTLAANETPWARTYIARFGSFATDAHLAINVGTDLERVHALKIGRKYRITVEEV